MNEQDTREPFASWAILELLGHRRLAGYLTEQEVSGHGFLRIDIPRAVPEGLSEAGQGWTTQLCNPTSVYAITPTTEEIARAVAATNQPEPVHRWELPTPTDEPRAVYAVGDGDDDLDHPF